MGECAGIKGCLVAAAKYVTEELSGYYKGDREVASVDPDVLPLPHLSRSEYLWQETPTAKCISKCNESHRNAFPKFKECMDSCLGKNKTGFMETDRVVIIGVGGAGVFSISVEGVSGMLDMSGSDRMGSDSVLRLLTGRMTIDTATGNPVKNLADDSVFFEMLLRAQGIRTHDVSD